MARAVHSARRRTGRGEVRRREPARRAPLPLPGAPDGLLIAAVAGLASFGLVMIYSATIHEGTTAEVVRKMAVQFGGGALGLLVGLLVPIHWWRRLTVPALVAAAAALASLLVPGNPFAITRLGATRWLDLGPLSFQPSEFAKLTFVLFGAGFLERRAPRLRAGHWGVYLLVLAVFGGLIYLEPDLGTALVLGGIALCLLWVARIHLVPFTGLVAGAAAGVFYLAMNKEHQRLRLLSWWNPWAYEDDIGHQVIQSWTAMARGGLWGVGLGESLQKLDNRLPEAETDFIFAVVAEELGLIGGAAVILLFVLFTWRGFNVALRAPDRYTMLLAAGVTTWVGGQALLNIGVVTGTLPNTGIPLPFLSSGGSSLLALMIGVGILISISRLTRPEGSNNGER